MHVRACLHACNYVIIMQHNLVITRAASSLAQQKAKKASWQSAATSDKPVEL